MKILYLSGINNTQKYGYYNAVNKRCEKLQEQYSSKITIDFISIPIIDSFGVGVLKTILKLPINSKLLNEDSIIKYYPYKRTLLSMLINFFNKDYIDNELYTMLEKIYCQNNYNYIHVHWTYPYGYIVSKLSEKYNLSYVLNIHGSDIHTNPNRNARLMKKTIHTLNNAKKIYCVSEELASEAYNILGNSQNKFITTYNGVNILDENLISNKMKKHIVFIGKLTLQKGADKIIPIYEYLLRNNVTVNITIIGDGPLYTLINDEVITKKLEINVLGFKNSAYIQDSMKNFDLLIMPSQNEGFGLSALEAYSFNIPVIATNVGGLKGLIMDKNFLIESNENLIENFGTEIIKYYENYTLYRNDELKYYNYAKNYSWDTIINIEGSEYL